MAQLQYLKIKEIKHIKDNKKLQFFNFSVLKNECYFVNGILSHNCFTYRFGRDKVYINDNVDQILQAIKRHAATLGKKIPNQTCPDYWTYDIGCDTDLVYHKKDIPLEKILNFTNEIPNAKFSFATKFVDFSLTNLTVTKSRIRFSIMPESIRSMVELNTTKISKRIEAVDRFIQAGWEVHLNFSPVIVTDTWEEDYKKLFEEINEKVTHKDKVCCEVIFLTHNKNLHEKNLKLDTFNICAEQLLWRPDIQEAKLSQYGGDNLRYAHQYKSWLVSRFQKLATDIIPWCKIRYIF